ncbi:MAG: class I SAM-dependent methyltransferase, partial [Acidimicrobiia bacterium]
MPRSNSGDLDRVLGALASDPPSVHPNAPQGVWAAAGDCLEFLAATVQPGSRTLETGCGATTIVFAAAGSLHDAVFLDGFEGEGVQAWCTEHGVSTDQVTFHAGSSSQTLPQLNIGPLDLVMVDGCHGFPFPQLDWYYTASHLVDGGILVVDDTHLPAPYELRRYLESDPRWERIRVGRQWVAFRRNGSGSLDEEWMSQPFHQPMALRVQGLRRQARGALGRLRRKLRAAA